MAVVTQLLRRVAVSAPEAGLAAADELAEPVVAEQPDAAARNLLQVPLKKVGCLLEQLLAEFSRHSVRLLRIDHHVEKLACFL